MNLANRYYIGGKDAWTEWGIFFNKGTFAELLKLPTRRDDYEYTWKDENGTERNVDVPYFDTRAVVLSMVMIGAGESDFKDKMKRFRDFIMSSAYFRSEERRVGKECVSTSRSLWSPYQ